jgi:7-cyano-7-deazaguanine synthase in queuosine biosynthesis
MKQLVLFNGGLKSLFLAELMKREGEVVLCYLQLQEKQGFDLRKIESLAKQLNLDLLIKPIMASPPLKEVLLHLLYLILWSLPIAQKINCRKIVHGISADDGPWGKDNLDAYLEKLGHLINMAQPLYDGKGHWLGDIEIETPLRQLNRQQVIRLGNRWNIDWGFTHSCSQRQFIHCGDCEECRRRLKVFRQEKCEDPAPYLSRAGL